MSNAGKSSSTSVYNVLIDNFKVFFIQESIVKSFSLVITYSGYIGVVIMTPIGFTISCNLLSYLIDLTEMW